MPSDTPSTPTTQLSNPLNAGQVVTDQKERRQQGPKTLYILLAPGTDKGVILDVHTNTRTLVESMEQNPGASYVKRELPQGEPRSPRGSKANGAAMAAAEAAPVEG